MATSRNANSTLNATELKRRTSVPSAARQHGQSAVFVLLFLGVLLISLNFLYKQGRVTSDKMEMQNAADAIAYSISLTEARDLNFAAYLNRAMVANEVAIGQLMGLASWAQLVESYGDFFNAFAKPLFPVPIIGQAISAAVGTVAGIFKTAGGTLEAFLGALGNVGTSFMHVSNMVYSWAQWGYHVASIFISTGLISELLDENAPPGTSVSTWGWMSLVTHFLSYGSAGNALSRVSDGSFDLTLPSAIYDAIPEDTQPQFSKFVEYYHPSREVNVNDYNNGDRGAAEGFERFAAITRDSGDPFTKDRSWDLAPLRFMAPIIDPIPLLSVDDAGRLNVDLEFEFDFCADLGICIDIGVARLDAGINFDGNMFFGIAVLRSGASELRMLIPANGTFEAGGVANWSSADTADLAASFGASIDADAGAEISFAEICLFGACITPPTISLRPGVMAGFELADNTFTFDGVEINFPIIGGVTVFPGFSIPFPSNVPFGAAFTEAGETNPNNVRLDDLTSALIGGDVPADAYGSAANSLAWNLPAVPPVAFPATGVLPGPAAPFMPPGVVPRSDTFIGPSHGDQTNRYNKSYPGLPGYIDTAGHEQTVFGFGAPQLTISLVLDEAEHDLDRAQANVDTSGAGNHPEMGAANTALTSDGLRLTDGMADGIFNNDPKLHTVARSEVYFKRPNDLDWFARLDGREEKGSAFNPYWQARLTEMPYPDSVAALMMEQGEDFTGATEVISETLDSIDELLDGLNGFLDELGLGLLFP